MGYQSPAGYRTETARHLTQTINSRGELIKTALTIQPMGCGGAKVWRVVAGNSLIPFDLSSISNFGDTLQKLIKNWGTKVKVGEQAGERD